MKLQQTPVGAATVLQSHDSLADQKLQAICFGKVALAS